MMIGQFRKLSISTLILDSVRFVCSKGDVAQDCVRGRNDQVSFVGTAVILAVTQGTFGRSAVMMKKVLLVLTILMAIAGSAQAGIIQGSTGWNIFGNITTVNSHTYIMPQPTGGLSGMYAKQGMGDFVAVPAYPAWTWLSSNTLDVLSPAGWTFGSDAFGTWVTTSGMVTSKNTSFMFLSLEGTFTPGTMFSGKTASAGTMTVGFNMSGDTAQNVNGTMSMNAVPEPMTLGLLGLGGLFLRRRMA